MVAGAVGVVVVEVVGVVVGVVVVDVVVSGVVVVDVAVVDVVLVSELAGRHCWTASWLTVVAPLSRFWRSDPFRVLGRLATSAISC